MVGTTELTKPQREVMKSLYGPGTELHRHRNGPLCGATGGPQAGHKQQSSGSDHKTELCPGPATQLTLATEVRIQGWRGSCKNHYYIWNG